LAGATACSRGIGADPPLPDARRAGTMRGNNQLPNAHFKKDWQGNTINGQCRVRTWLNQGALMIATRSFAGRAAVNGFPRARARVGAAIAEAMRLTKNKICCFLLAQPAARSLAATRASSRPRRRSRARSRALFARSCTRRPSDTTSRLASAAVSRSMN